MASTAFLSTDRHRHLAPLRACSSTAPRVASTADAPVAAAVPGPDAGREGARESVARSLVALASVGHHVFRDPRPPRDRRHHAALVLVGPGGVFLLDVAEDLQVEGDQVLHGDRDVTDDVLALADVAYRAEGELVEVGLAPGEVRPVVVVTDARGVDRRIGPVRLVGEADLLRHVASYGSRLPAVEVELVLARLREMLPDLVPVVLELPEVPTPHDGRTHPSTLDVDEALVAGAAARPVESWMAVLDPAQAALVRRSFNGPCRIRGGAGTGKTLVGLHRAAYLARSRPGTVLVTSLVQTLPDVLRHQLAALAPDVADRVQLVCVQEWARRLLAARGVRVAVDESIARIAFDDAFAALAPDNPLHVPDCGPGYWRVEISKVIKGRGITDLAGYLDIARTGRRYPMSRDQRAALWELYRAYERRLGALGVHDADDLVLMAADELRRRPLDVPYSAVIVDEVQDLTAAGVRLLHGLVGDVRDGLTLIGDVQQAVYPGGWTLADVGVSVAGRGVVLTTNYRNTAQILDLAHRVVAGDEVTDLDGGVVSGERPEQVRRHGAEPVLERCGSRREQHVAMIARARTVARDAGTAGVAVLCATNGAAVHAADALRAAGLSVLLLTDYDGTQAAAVKVGTIKRAKGLEFSHVLLPDVCAELLERGDPPAGAADRERWELQRRELHSAITRARDGLWLGVA
ncbi:AAA family ATPase [Isoptericola sp. b490]|uniref:UvrD-helicase domain-containing protein n=1 Tax=Actinotalea lenta TaxID=3064654 RepID=UPI0027140D28|nr:UvrD-helicase domain-containing protein [Isoptericola sp. b490]MDO8122255.1 AAA family ATPase [Isoptericola sp. b490]